MSKFLIYRSKSHHRSTSRLPRDARSPNTDRTSGIIWMAAIQRQIAWSLRFYSCERIHASFIDYTRSFPARTRSLVSRRKMNIFPQLCMSQGCIKIVDPCKAFNVKHLVWHLSIGNGGKKKKRKKDMTKREGTKGSIAFHRFNPSLFREF